MSCCCNVAKSESNFFCFLYFRVDNNHLLLLMIHVFRENEEQLYKVNTEIHSFEKM